MIAGDADSDDMGWSPKTCDTNIVAGGSGDSALHGRSELTRNAGASPVIISKLTTRLRGGATGSRRSRRQALRVAMGPAALVNP